MLARYPFAFVALALLTNACGTTAPAIDGAGPDASVQEPPTNGSGEGQKGNADGGPVGPEGSRIVVSLRGSTVPFVHADAWSGETPNDQTVAIRSLYLLRSPTDPDPVKVFDHGANAVEVELVGGKITEVASVVAKTLPPGVFTIAKAGVAYVRYSVNARMHSVVSIDGRYKNVQVLSDGAVIDGETHAKGHFRYSFEANGTNYGTLVGEDAPVPAVASSGGLSLDTSGPQSFYVFPVQVAINPDNITTDVAALLEVNVHESFRWVDQPGAGFAAKVFDTTPSMFEPVMTFGGNSFSLTFLP